MKKSLTAYYELKYMKVFITAGSSFIGSNACAKHMNVEFYQSFKNKEGLATFKMISRASKL